jgi:hypothetical protein
MTMDLDDETVPNDEASTPPDNTRALSKSNKRPLRSNGQDWEVYRDIIKELYNRMPLKEVITYMSEQYGFFATARMYKTRLNHWGLNKYMKKRDMQSLVHRIRSSGSPRTPMDLEIDGKAVPLAKVERFAKRKGQALNREGPAPSTTPHDANSPSRTDLLGGDYIYVDSTCQEIEIGLDDTPSPTTTLTTQATSPPPPPPAQIDVPQRASGIFPASGSHGTPLGPFNESPEPHLLGIIPSGSRRLHNQASVEAKGLPCPRAPRPRTRTLPSPMQSDTIQQALLLSIILSAMIQQRPVGELSDVRLDTMEQQATLDMSVFTPVVDLLGWLQLDRPIVLLAAIYLVRFDASATFPKSHNVWQQLLVALKFAQAYLHDEPYSAYTWTHAIPHLANCSIGQGILEMDVLGDEHIRLHVDQSKWKLLEIRLSHVSASLLVSLERGIFTFKTTQQRPAGPMELTSSGFL